MLNFRKIGILCSLVICFIPQALSGLEASYGPQKLQNTTATNLLHNGRLNLNNMQISGETRVNGTLDIHNSTLQDVTINGRGNIENSMIKGNIRTNGMLNLTKVQVEGSVEVAGYVQIDGATIKGEFIVAADKIEIKNATLFRIRVRPTLAMLNKADPSLEKQTVILNNTKVLGNVVFENENGEVIQQKSSILGSILGVKAQEKK